MGNKFKEIGSEFWLENIKREKDRGIVFIFEDSPELNRYCNMFYELTGGLKKELVK